MREMHFGIKLHAQYCAPRSWAKARAHEVFAHPFRLPRRGGKMAHLVFLLCFCIAKISSKEKIVSAEHAADTAFFYIGLFLKPGLW